MFWHIPWNHEIFDDRIGPLLREMNCTIKSDNIRSFDGMMQWVMKKIAIQNAWPMSAFSDV